MNEQGTRMNRFVKMSLLAVLMSQGIYAQEGIAEIDSTAVGVIVDSGQGASRKGSFATYEFGASKISLGSAYHKAFHFTTKTEYKFDNNIALYLEGSSNYYRYLGDIHDMGISSFGMSYDVPYTDNKLSLGAAIGVGMNLNYSTLFSHFKQSFDFGLSYRINVNYNFDREWGMNIAYNKFDFNTNKSQMEDTKPEIVNVSLVYTFDRPSFF